MSIFGMKLVDEVTTKRLLEHWRWGHNFRISGDSPKRVDDIMAQHAPYFTGEEKQRFVEGYSCPPTRTVIFSLDNNLLGGKK